jgi:NADH pyrophosphatase NudC (nudix superfamily)
MDIAALFFTLAILVLVAMYLYAPLAERSARPVTEEEHELSALMAERDRIINSLQELDFDFKLGKIPSEDYPTQRANLLQKGADILRKIDERTSQQGSKPQNKKNPSRRNEKPRVSSSTPEASAAVQNQEERIERTIATRRVEVSIAMSNIKDDDLESMISARRRNHKEKSAGFCPNCGKPVLSSDRFCASCGKALT